MPSADRPEDSAQSERKTASGSAAVDREIEAFVDAASRLGRISAHRPLRSAAEASLATSDERRFSSLRVRPRSIPSVSR
jgi:hypothetical protein